MSKSIAKYIGIVVISLVLGCNKDDGITPVPDPVQETLEPGESTLVPTFSSISPTNGPKETLVSLKGENFGADISKVKVFFNDREAIVQTVSDTQITALVPLKAGTGLIKVNIDNQELIGPKFDYQLTAMVSTFAGIDQGDADGTISEALFHNPSAIAMDQNGDFIIADSQNHKIKKITTDGIVSTLAGTKQGLLDGSTSVAQFNYPTGVAVDSLGNVYVSDHGNHRIRKITPFGVVFTLAGSTMGYSDGTGFEAKFKFPWGIALDKAGNLFVSDLRNNSIRQISPEGTVSTLAGGIEGFEDGPGETARFNFPMGLTVDENNNIYVADYGNHKIRKVMMSGEVTTLAGSTTGFSDGSLIEAQFNGPTDISIGSQGTLYLVDSSNHRLRKIEPNGSVSTLAGGEKGYLDDIGTAAQFNVPLGMVINGQGVLYVMDTNNHRIRKIVQE